MRKFVLPVLVGGLVLLGAACSKSNSAGASASAAEAAAPRAVNVVQPGAPGAATKALPKGEVPSFPTPQPSMEDIMFMQGMVEHHAQALYMVDLLRTHTNNSEMHAVGDKIFISQSEEIKTMQDWLRDHHEAVPVVGAKGVVTLNGKVMMPMPGMLTPAQMHTLASEHGVAFDHSFLTLMIQHHTGALSMVTQLRNTPGADQEAGVFNFATDIDVSQTAQIRRMRGLLGEKIQ
ncbi:MAG: DUF305 domain-containing protein [Terriglobales bacterium]